MTIPASAEEVARALRKLYRGEAIGDREKAWFTLKLGVKPSVLEKLEKRDPSSCQDLIETSRALELVARDATGTDRDISLPH